MSASRLALATAAFQSLNPSFEGTVTLEALRKKYAARNHPDVKAGKQREGDCLREFLTSVDLGGDGLVCCVCAPCLYAPLTLTTIFTIGHPHG